MLPTSTVAVDSAYTWRNMVVFVVSYYSLSAPSVFLLLVNHYLGFHVGVVVAAMPGLVLSDNLQVVVGADVACRLRHGVVRASGNLQHV